MSFKLKNQTAKNAYLVGEDRHKGFFVTLYSTNQHTRKSGRLVNTRAQVELFGENHAILLSRKLVASNAVELANLAVSEFQKENEHDD